MSWRDLKMRLKEQLSEILEIPSDVILDLPKIIIMGDLHVFLENHRGIYQYNTELIRVASGEGEIEITGEGLQLRNIYPNEMCIQGQIKSITFIK
ncbi:MAG: sporulation protein YqfC [Clostridiales bacterium]|nr:sporulation protein YqfC [Clostridiales bacterium]MCF8021446.1 sporulation protein YqfC [Clostridiales bacterium]